ncbi:perilipin-2-like [Spea bombifrons]|uniref:perilipin-2-like n=1 Tax=Spea bombifrons TaxID=233779 RepID=UPI00234B5993|nr:perilipin-2-like [Spea bombifrons]
MAGREQEQIQPENALYRMARLPLVQSSYQILTFAYQDIKNLNPLVGYFCSMSERGAKAASHVAAKCVAPVLSIMGPQISTINKAAVWMVDELEVRLPVLDQPADEVVSDFQDKLVDTVGAMKGQVLERLQNSMDRVSSLARDARDAVSLAAFTFRAQGLKELVKLGAELVMSQAEELLHQYFPETDEGRKENVGSYETEETGSATPKLVSGILHFINAILARGLRRLNPVLDSAWGLLHGLINLLRSLSYEMKRLLRRVARSPFGSREDSKLTEGLKRNKRDPPARLLRSAPKKRTFLKPKHSVHQRDVSTSFAAANGRHGSSERVRGLQKTQSRGGPFQSSTLWED